MAVTLIVEDGTGTLASNTYVDETDVAAFLELRGLRITATDELLKQFIIRAKDYLEAQRTRFQGDKAVLGQKLQFPRTSVVIDNETLDETTIPVNLTDAQCQLVWEIDNDSVLFPVAPTTVLPTEGAVKKRAIGPLVKEFYDPNAAATAAAMTSGQTSLPTVVRIPAVEAFLAPILQSSQMGSVRV